MSHAWRGANRAPLRPEQMRPFKWLDHKRPTYRKRPPSAICQRAAELADKGFTFSQIAEMVRCTRNAAAGRVRRGRAVRK